MAFLYGGFKDDPGEINQFRLGPRRGTREGANLISYRIDRRLKQVAVLGLKLQQPHPDQGCTALAIGVQGPYEERRYLITC